MKHLKMFILAAGAVMALMATAGASTASADEICTEPAVSNMCPAGKLITSFDWSLVGGGIIWVDTSKNTLDTCTSGGMKVTTLSEANGNKTGTASIKGESTAADITWGSAGTNCTFTTTTLKGGTATATEAAGGGTTVTAAGTEVTINTGLFGSCVYTFGTGIDLGSMPQGGRELNVEKAVTKVSGLCPTSIIIILIFRLTNHTAVYYINN